MFKYIVTAFMFLSSTVLLGTLSDADSNTLRVVLLLALAGFIATANKDNLDATATLIVGLFVTILAIGLLWRAVQGFMTGK